MIVTSIDAAFLPGIKALHNSILRHSPDTPLACFTYGDDDLAETVDRMGVEVHHNVLLGAFLPPGNGTPVGCDPMYARLLGPEIYDKCVWLDADQIVRTDLSPLLNMEFPQPVAAVRDTHAAQRSVVGINTGNTAAIMSGLMVFNVPEWRKRGLFAECLRIMELPSVEFKLVVQSVLNVALRGDFFSLTPAWQGFANRRSTNPKDFRVLHWHGRGDKPWTNPDMPNADVWREYA